MTSPSPEHDLDFERDVPTTAADVAALRAARQLPRRELGLADIDLLSEASSAFAGRPNRSTAEGRPPFELDPEDP